MPDEKKYEFEFEPVDRPPEEQDPVRPGWRPALFGNDPDKAPRCPQCGYILLGLPELRCPECGCRPQHVIVPSQAEGQRRLKRGAKLEKQMNIIGAVMLLLGLSMAITGTLLTPKAGLFCLIFPMAGFTLPYIVYLHICGDSTAKILVAFGVIWLFFGTIILLISL
ncbi:MAG: hypothetical protein ABIG44_01430 [Planctomycetota bacterium]